MDGKNSKSNIEIKIRLYLYEKLLNPSRRNKTMRKSQLRQIIKEEIGILRENVDTTFLDKAISIFASKTGINLNSFPVKKTDSGNISSKSPNSRAYEVNRIVYKYDLSKELGKSKLLFLMFKSAIMQVISEEDVNSIRVIFNLYWDSPFFEEYFALVGTISFNKKTGKEKIMINMK